MPVSTTEAELTTKVGGVCAIVGAVTFATARLLHGDIPAADAAAALDFVNARPIFAAVHLVAVFAALVTLAGLAALAGSFAHPRARVLGRAAVAVSTIGLAVFGVESTSEGLGLSVLAQAEASASPAARDELVVAARAVAEATFGPSLLGMALLVGVPLLLLGLAMVADTYPLWLGWAGTAVGAATVGAAACLFVAPAVIPGVLLYGLLASVLAQVWIAATGVVMLRRARSG